jgi:hypothetical protein
MRPFLLIVLPLCLFLSCTKEDPDAPGTEIEIYTLSYFKTVPGICRVDASSAVLNFAPVVNNADIVRYDQSSYTYHLTPSAVARLDNQLKAAQPFAVTVDKQPVFFGFYRPGYLSSLCMESITMAYIAPGGNTIRLDLGYPSFPAGVSASFDHRNHPRLLATLKAQGKLW